MSDKTNNQKLIKLRVIKENSVVKIDIGDGFHVRIQQLLFYILKDHPAEKVILALENIKTKEPADDFEYHVLTLLSLLYANESAFEAAGCLIDKEVPATEGS